MLSTILLNWNRAELLSQTLESYLKTIDVDYELFIVDNGSTDASTELIKSICNKPNHHAILLEKNIGGPALNIGAEMAKGDFLHFSENDMEYLPHWTDMLSKFDTFPELGQLSFFAPSPQIELGEIFSDKSEQVETLTRNGLTIYKTSINCGTTCIIRKSLWNLGLNWGSYGKGDIWFPDDGGMSQAIKTLGYIVAYNDEYKVINWGHNIHEFLRDTNYYISNYDAKTWFGIDGFEKRLKEHGYTLQKDSKNGYIIVPHSRQ